MQRDGRRKQIILQVVDNLLLLTYEGQTEIGNFWCNEQYLRDHGFTWEGMDVAWVPVVGERYYFPVAHHKDRYCWTNWYNDNTDKFRSTNNLVCRTPEEATSKAQQMLDAIKST